MTSLITSTALLLSEPSVLAPWASDPVPEPSEVKPGWITLVVVLLLVAATTLLWLSLRKHLGRIQVPREDEDEDSASSEADQRDRS